MGLMIAVRLLPYFLHCEDPEWHDLMMSLKSILFEEAMKLTL